MKQLLMCHQLQLEPGARQFTPDECESDYGLTIPIFLFCRNLFVEELGRSSHCTSHIEYAPRKVVA